MLMSKAADSRRTVALCVADKRLDREVVRLQQRRGDGGGLLAVRVQHRDDGSGRRHGYGSARRSRWPCTNAMRFSAGVAAVCQQFDCIRCAF